MKKILLLASVSTLLLTSCTVTKMATSKTMDIYGPGVIHNPVIVDLDISEEKVKGTATGTSGSSIESLKHEAVANAIKTATADVLVEPSFEVEDGNGKITATVTGFPAKYKNFRNIKESDLPLLQAGVIQKAEVSQPVAAPKKKGRGLGAVVGGLLGTALVITLVTLLAG